MAPRPAAQLNARMQNDIWAALPDEARSAVDALVRRDRRIHAVQVIREAFAQGAKPGLTEALDVVVERYRALEQPLFTSTPPLDLEKLAAAVAALPVRPDAIEALWDGDTDGWFVVLFAVTAAPWRQFELAVSRLGTDLRLFDGEAPPWPEAVEAREVGGALARQLDVPFAFASPERPDDTAPRWWDGR